MNVLSRVLAVCGAVAAAHPALGQELLWSIPAGSPEEGVARGLSRAHDGGVFSAGQAPNGACAGQCRAWVRRYDSSGRLLWIRVLDTPAGDGAIAVAADGAGGVFATGYTEGSLAGPNQGDLDIWMARFDAVGEIIWIEQFGSEGADGVFSLVPDGAGGVFLGGNTNGALAGPASPGYRAWLARYTGSGQRLWLRQYEFGGGSQALLALVPDGGGGVFAGGMDWPDALVLRFDGVGEVVWLRRYLQSGNFPRSLAWSLSADDSGGVFAAGWTINHIYGETGWIARYDADGRQIWVRGWTPVFASAPDGIGGVFIGREGFSRFDEDGELQWTDPDSTHQPQAIAPAGPLGAYTGGLRGLTRFGPCYANCDESPEPPVLNVADFACFLQRFAVNSPYANCDQSTTPPVLNVADFACFLQRFAAGCE